ncbi:MAG: hypothetical protein DBX44_00400 [Oscillospiraceae bacterium]|nr:MAG: hypothetical protein DBX44_00400 [Oscillospiraceae bacterium]
MKVMLRVMAALGGLLLLFSAAGGAPADSPSEDLRWPVTVRETTITGSPRRVVSLSPAMTASLIELGFAGRLAGVSDSCILPDALGEIERCGSALLPDTAAILALQPDLVVASTDLPAALTGPLQEAGIPLLVIRRAADFDGILDNYRALATAMQGEEQGERIAEQLEYFAQQTLSYLNDAVSRSVAEGTSAVYLRKMPFIIATGDTLEGSWLTDLGLVNQAQEFEGWDYPLEAEPDLNPNYIFCDRSVTLEALQSSDYYRRTSAVTNLRVIPLDGQQFEQQSPRMFLVWEEAVRTAFPEAFDGVERPSIVLPMEPPPAPEPEPESWWESLFGH